MRAVLVGASSGDIVNEIQCEELPKPTSSINCLQSQMQEIIAQNEYVSDRIMEKASHHMVIGNKLGGVLLKTSFDNANTQGIIKHLNGTLVSLTRSAVRDIDPADDLRYLRVVTKKSEYLVAVEVEFTIVVQQQHV